jgi:hypothetical protein
MTFDGNPGPVCLTCGTALIPATILALRREEAMAGIVAGALRAVCIELHAQNCVRADCVADPFAPVVNPDCFREIDALIKLEMDRVARRIVNRGQPA